MKKHIIFTEEKTTYIISNKIIIKNILTIAPAGLRLLSTFCQSKLGAFWKQSSYTEGYLGFAVNL
jgi:hypothetical protein